MPPDRRKENPGRPAAGILSHGRPSVGSTYLLAGLRGVMIRSRRSTVACHGTSFGPIPRAHTKTKKGGLTGTHSARIDRGDVFWMGPDDSRGPVPSYSHPCVVVQNDVFNYSRITTVVVCAMTSNLHRANEPGNILLEAGEGHLPKQSVVVVSQVSSVEKARLGERIGSLSDARVAQILAGLRFQQVSFFER